jgi:hypothetical protein
MAFDKVKKAAWRQRPEVQQRQRQYKRNWNQANRSHIAHYMRERGAGRWSATSHQQ